VDAVLGGWKPLDSYVEAFTPAWSGRLACDYDPDKARG
jgi:hypothetical protein